MAAQLEVERPPHHSVVGLQALASKESQQLTKLYVKKARWERKGLRAHSIDREIAKQTTRMLNRLLALEPRHPKLVGAAAEGILEAAVKAASREHDISGLLDG